MIKEESINFYTHSAEFLKQTLSALVYFIAAMINHRSSYHSPLNLSHVKLRPVGMLLGTINLLPGIRYRLLIGLWTNFIAK